MTAGRGIVHAEVSPREFLETGGPIEILQLWVNLPSRLKMSEPAYTGLQRADIPALQLDGGKVTMNLIAGQWEGNQGPVQSLTGVFMSTLQMRAGGSLRITGLEGRNVFLYVARGAVQVGNHADLVSPMHLVELDEAGDTLELRAAQDALLVFGHADPIREPVVSHGPFVMTTREEIAQAIDDYQAGRFGSALG
jgi:redox-sensitive bicupin YhaK (pirin superfamily)